MKQTILALEDEPLILDEVRETLVDDGFNVLTAETAEDFWALAENHRIDQAVEAYQQLARSWCGL
jgi:DNA-binding response OmpR family regulator